MDTESVLVALAVTGTQDPFSESTSLEGWVERAP